MEKITETEKIEILREQFIENEIIKNKRDQDQRDQDQEQENYQLNKIISKKGSEFFLI